MRTLTPEAQPEWAAEIDQVFAEGFPFANETVFYHKASRTVIMTDLCQWWTGDLNLPAKLYAGVTGVRARLGVPRTIRAGCATGRVRGQRAQDPGVAVRPRHRRARFDRR